MEQRRPQPREPVVELQRHRRCVETVGRRGRGYLGARHDWWRTATLSYKCFAAAFRNIFVREREAPLELPTSIAAYRSQQTRWFKGFGQPFAKKAADAFTSSNTPVVHKVVFFFHTLPSLCYADGHFPALLLAGSVCQCPLFVGVAGGEPGRPGHVLGLLLADAVPGTRLLARPRCAVAHR